MRLLFALYKYFPYGGLQKDMLAIANECAARGHKVDIYCRTWDGEKPLSDNITVYQHPNNHLTNVEKNRAFQTVISQQIKQGQYDLVIGFNKIPGIDMYFAADTCFKAKLFRERPWLYRLLPRYRQQLQEEASVFESASTYILGISASALDEYREFYSLSESRYCLLPPGISRDFINADGQRLSILHDELMLDAKQRIVLMVGSGFKTKGLDRAIDALASLPEPLKKITHLVVAGDDRPDQFIRQAKDHGLEKQVHFLGGRKDILKLFRSADVLIHPAYREAAGIVLLEAAVSALPVITTQVCGNAHYIADNQLGVVIPQPFQQSALNAALYAALTDTPQQQKQQQQWRNNCRVFAAQADIYSMATVAADKIERLAQLRQKK